MGSARWLKKVAAEKMLPVGPVHTGSIKEAVPLEWAAIPKETALFRTGAGRFDVAAAFRAYKRYDPNPEGVPSPATLQQFGYFLTFFRRGNITEESTTDNRRDTILHIFRRPESLLAQYVLRY